MRERILNIDGMPVYVLFVDRERRSLWSPFKVALVVVGVAEMLIGAVLFARLM